MRNFVQGCTVIFATLCMLIFAIVVYGSFIIPNNVTVAEYGKYETPKIFGLSIFTCSNNPRSASLIKNEPRNFNEDLEVDLLNIIPIKRTFVKNIKRQYVVLGGEIFGIKLYTDGVLVVDIDLVEADNGKINPAQNAGIRVGDIIKSVNGEKVYTNNRLSQIIENSCGNELNIEFVRDNQVIKTKLNSIKDKTSGKYKAGIWVRDSTAGIGTVTFYNPNDNSFGGLGHAICDVDTGEIMPMINGEMADAYVNGFYKSFNGCVGELCGVFTGKKAGGLCLNTNVGIYGYSNSIPNKEEILPVALSNEVKTEKAEMICTIDKNGPKAYKIEIVKLLKKNGDINKDMIIKITDDELLSKTGGILQGMSGSPIVQNGMLVGAVTHVFVNNPTQGYAVFAEKMLNTSSCEEMCSYVKEYDNAS